MPIVYRSKTEDRKAFVTHVLRELSPLLEAAQTVFVKVNLVSSEPCPTTTHPDTLAAVLEALAGRDTVVGDAPALDALGTDKIVHNAALKQLCDARGVPFVNLYKSTPRKVTSPRGYSFTMYPQPLEHDLVISLPVLKSHNVCRMSGALKNQFGYLPRKERVVMHVGGKNIHKGIAELNVAAKPDIVILDAVQTLVCAQELRHGGTLADLGYMLAGTDPVAVDCLGLEILQQVEPRLAGASPNDVPQLRYAIEYGVGSAEFDVQEVEL
jgi:uncharacterized protein (DUF362 family)